MIPSPKLDDREFHDIVAEALRLIPRYAPEWTNHNPSDPGITLIELAAWMTDIILYRLNRVPEKNYVAFLNLLGITLKPPQAAKAFLQFNLVENASRQIIREGTQVATPQAADEDTVTFETSRDSVVTNVKLDRCFSYFNESYSDNSPYVGGSRLGGFEAFGGAERVERYIYLSDPRFAGCGDAAVLRVFLGCPERGGRDLARLLEWEYWNGDRWKDLRPAPMEVERGEACFQGPLRFAPVSVNEIEGLWLRGRLAEVPEDPQETEMDTIRARVEVVGDGVAPDRAFANLESNAYILLDTGKLMYPFGKEPKPDCILYVSCDELLRTPDAEVRIEFVLADSAVVPKPNPSDDLTLAWEYYDGKKWRMFGKSSPRGVRPGFGDEFGFHEETKAFTATGTIAFHRPKDMAVVYINGEERRWIRVRIEQGDFGVAGAYTLEGDKWMFKDDRPLRPPAFRLIAFRYREEYRDVRYVLTYNDFQYKDVTEDARTEFTIFQPFAPRADESPSLYLGFTAKYSNERHAFYFSMADHQGPPPSAQEDVLVGELSEYLASQQAEWESEQRVVWEYYSAKGWVPLPVQDATGAFTTSGFLDFVGPDDWDKTMKFTEERYWLRARLEMGGYVRPPRIQRILTNTVEARNAVTVRDEALGSSDGTPLQSFTLLHGPLLEGETIEVREKQRPTPEELEDLGGDSAVTPVNQESSEECWIRWRCVESFFDSKGKSRHYRRDFQTRKITFGDGRSGMIPPEGRNNVIARRYQTGGGSGGNVNANTLTALTRAIAYIDSVTNPLGAAGGADRETVEEAKGRAPHTIRSRDRAVTAEDFETLALRAHTSLARAKCLPDPQHRGAVTVAIIPRGDTDKLDLTRKLLPSQEVIRFVKRYLDERRLVGTVLYVVRPRYKDFTVKVTLLRRTVGTSDCMRRDIEEKLRRFLHPLVGGRDGKGWLFGRGVLKSDLVHLVEEVPGVEGVDSLQMVDEEREVSVEQIRLDDDQLPFLVHVYVVEKVRDDII